MNVPACIPSPGILMALSANWRQLQETLKMEATKPTTIKNVPSSNGDARSSRKRKAKLAIKNTKRQKLEGHFSSSWVDTSTSAASSQQESELTKALGLDCEYVGVGPDASENMLARVSIVNFYGHCVYDKFVKPREKITDYRTSISGIRPGNLLNGEPFQKVQQEVHKLLSGRIVVGHALKNDFKVLNLSHTRKMTRDSARYLPIRKMANVSRTPSLKLLAKEILGIDIQHGEHDSITDARVAMRLYALYRKQWDSDVKRLTNGR